ncbi:MAG: flagellar motor protein MotB [Geminicoccaceae bacterium]
MAKDEAPAGAPMWMVTFADLMSLLVCFFVLIISFSVPDTEKIKIVAGSMNNAFGFTREIAVTGMVEIDGNPQFKFARDVVPIPLDNVIGPIDEEGNDITKHQQRPMDWVEIDEALLEELEKDFEDENEPLVEEEPEDGFEPVLAEPLTEEEKFERVEEKLSEVIESHPELGKLADNLSIERVAEGLRIQMIDQAKQSMFPIGSALLYPEAQSLLTTVVAAMNSLPNPVWISGHTDALVFKRRDGYDNWSLSLDRANSTRRMLVEAGLDPARIASVIGKGDTEHMVPERPTDPRNRRISITLLREEPPPADGSVADGAAPERPDDEPFELPSSLQ